MAILTLILLVVVVYAILVGVEWYCALLEKRDREDG